MKLPKLCQKTVKLCEHVADFIRKEAESFNVDKVEKKGFNDLVSYVDKQAEMQLVEGLKYLFPEAGFITEEGTVNEKADEYNWIIDPLDGTTNFVHSLPIYSISVALMQNDELVLGVVYEVNKKEAFHAYKGGGAFCNEKPIKVTPAKTLSESLIATGFPYTDFGLTEDYLKVLGSFMGKSHGVRRLGSAAVDLAYVAAGRFEGFFEFNLNAWDVAAGIIIVKEAGGEVSKFTAGGDPVFGREIVASNGAIHEEMLEVIAEFWKK